MEGLRKIMVVDDDHHVVRLVEMQLRSIPDLAVQTFTDPTEALARARSVRFDVVISDFRMPHMDGVEFLQTLAQMQPWCARLALSGKSDTDALTRLVNDASIYRFLHKPWAMKDLQELVREALLAATRPSEPHPRGPLPRPTTTTLRTAALLATLPESHLEALAAVANWQVYKAGETIVRQNDESHAVHFVIAGYVKVVRGGSHTQSVHTEGGDERRVRSRHQVMVALLGPGDMVGEVATLLDAKRSASIVALTPCQVLSLPGADFLATMQKQPEFALAVARKMARRLVQGDHQLELMRGDLEGRIHALLRQCRAIGLDTERWLNNAEIARMVGATRAAVSPIMGRLDKNR